MAKLDLEFLARQIERVITDLATMKDDAMAVRMRLDPIEATVQSQPPPAPGERWIFRCKTYPRQTRSA